MKAISDYTADPLRAGGLGAAQADHGTRVARSKQTRCAGADVAWVAAIAAFLVFGGCDRAGQSHQDQAAAASRNRADSDAGSAGVVERVAHLEALAPGQGALMSQLGYHFENLWFALDSENWPLAAFYLHECRETLEQAVEARPVRKLSTGEDLNIKGIAEAMDNTQFADLEKAIAAKEKAKAQETYRDAMIVCFSCHQAAEMPFLRLQMPQQPRSSLIQFDPSPSE